MLSKAPHDKKQALIPARFPAALCRFGRALLQNTTHIVAGPNHRRLLEELVTQSKVHVSGSATLAPMDITNADAWAPCAVAFTNLGEPRSMASTLPSTPPIGPDDHIDA